MSNECDIDDQHQRALDSIRKKLQNTTCYDILPESFRLIVLDNKLPITKSLQALVTNGVVSAPLYDSSTQRFAGMFTLSDVVHLIQYYYLTAQEYDNVIEDVERFPLESLRKIERAIGVPPPPTFSIHPDEPLSHVCSALVRTHARRLPLVDRDDQTGRETIVHVLTQYRVLRFIATNCRKECAMLNETIASLGIGSYCSWYNPLEGGAGASGTSVGAGAASPNMPAPVALPSDAASSAPGSSAPSSRVPTPPPGATGFGVSVTDRFFPLSTATMQTSVFDVVHIFSERGISGVPIVDDDGVVLNMYETVDVVDLVRQNAYDVLDKTIEVALQQRSSDFNGVMTCTPQDTLGNILHFIKEHRCHRLIIIQGEDSDGSDGLAPRKRGTLVGILSLSDVMRYLIGSEDLKGYELQGLGARDFSTVPPDDDDDENKLKLSRTVSFSESEAPSDAQSAEVESYGDGGDRESEHASVASVPSVASEAT